MSGANTIRAGVYIVSILIFFGCQGSAQKKIENVLVEKELITPGQLSSYHKKIKAEKEFVRMMGGLTQDEREEYKKENEKKNNDTLLVLAEILEATTKKSFYNDPPLDPVQRAVLKAYTHKLVSCKFITDSMAGTINKYIDGSYYLSDSIGIVNHAIGLRDKARSTTPEKLVALMNILKDAKILSAEKYDQLAKKNIPNSVNKIKHIVSQCEKKIFTGTPFSVANGKKEFLSLMKELERLTGIEIEQVNAILIPDNGSMAFNAIPVIELKYQGKKFSYKCYGVGSSDTNPDPYSLIGHDFYRVFNTILALKGAPYRLHRIEEKNPSDYIYMPWYGFIVLDRQQSDKLYRNEHLDLSYEENIDPLTNDNITRAIGLYKEAGLLTRLSQPVIDSVVAEIKQEPIFRYNELVARFPIISMTVEEKLPLSAQEAISLLKKLAAVSDHVFNPGNPRIEKDINGKDVLKFEWQGITFSEEFVGSWMNIWSPVHNAVFGDRNRKAQFETIRISQDKQVYFFLPYEKTDWLEKKKVIGDW